MVKLRLARAGSKKRPIYRIIAADSRSPRDGRFIESLGQYDPTRKPPVFDIDDMRLQHWLDQGAQPSETLHKLILRRKRELAAAATA
jgi:small subunit ribosomal protein S16